METTPRLALPCVGLTADRSGVAPLTADAVRRACGTRQPVLCLSVFDSAEAADRLRELNTSYASFTGLSEFPVVQVVRPAACGPHASAPSSETGLTAIAHCGRVTVNAKSVTDLADTVGAQFLVPLYDSGAMDQAPSRRVRQAQQRTKAFGQVTASDVRSMIPITQLSDDHVPATRPVALVNMGLGETAEQQLALMNSVGASGASVVLVCVQQLSALRPAVAALRGRCVIATSLYLDAARRGFGITVAGAESGRDALVNLWDPAHALAQEPIDPSCDCMPCSRHTRGYVHHLLCAREMNGELLLAEHNLRALNRIIGEYAAA